MQDTNLFLRRDLRFTANEAAKAALLNPKTLGTWIDRGVTGLRKDIRIGRWLFDANDVLLLRVMAELVRQCGTDPIKTRDTAKQIAEEWYTRHVQLGEEELECLVALNDGSPIVVCLPPVPAQIPPKAAQKMLKEIDHEYKQREILSGAHLQIPVSTLAMDVQDRLLKILAEQGE